MEVCYKRTWKVSLKYDIVAIMYVKKYNLKIKLDYLEIILFIILEYLI